MNFLSIQSHVAYGHVGNAAAVFPLQRIGCEVWPIHTVQFSNHTGYDSWEGRVFGADLIRDVVAGIAERGVLARCDGVLSGYVGAADVGEAILDAVARVKQVNPQALYCCDPVLGDVGRGLFVPASVAAFVAEHAVPAADIVTPNHFELDHLTGRHSRTLADALAAIARLHDKGPRTVLVTSLRSIETPADALDLVVSDQRSRFRLRTPLLPIAANGAGDLIAALFFAHYCHTASAAASLARAAASVFGVLRRTAEAGARELLLVEAQQELVDPSLTFEPEPV